MRLNKSQRKKQKKYKKREKLLKKARIEIIKRKRINDEVFSYKKPSEWRLAPEIFPESIPMEKRREIIADIIAKAKKDFDETFPELKQWFKDFDSCYILSYYAFYFMSQKQGTTNEHEGDYEHYQHYVEILQAIALTEPRKIDTVPLNEKSEVLEKQMSKLGSLIQFKHLDIVKDDTAETISRKSIIAQARNNTTAIRNWAYYFQMERVTTEVMATINDEFNSLFGVSSEDLAKILFGLPKLSNEKFQVYLSKCREVFKQNDKAKLFRVYEEQFPNVSKTTSKEQDELFEKLEKSTKQLKLALIAHSNLELQDIYTFTTEEVINLTGKELSPEKIEKLLDKLSYKFGDLKNQVLDHIILDNPISRKPLIKLEKNKYFSPSVASIPHFAFQILENLIAEDNSLSQKYSKRKGQYCEDFVGDLLKKNFPSANIYQNIKWERTDNTNAQFETDNLLIAGTFALVIESKSGKLTPQARRGAEDRLQRHIDELVLEPSRQSANFISAIKEGKLKNVRNNNGQKIEIDFSGVKYFVPISITLENLSMMSEAREIYKAGMNKELKAEDISLCMTLTDLECIFDILPLESMKWHYFVRRREFSMHVEILGDEMDLLGLYLEKGFNIGDTEYEGNLHMNLIMLSANIDKYFMLLDDEPIPPPDPYLTVEWKTLLESLASRKPNGWIEASFALLNCDNDDQKKFNKQGNKLLSDFSRGNLSKYPKNPYMVFTTGAKERRTAILLYPFKNEEREKRNNTIANIMSEVELDECKIKLAFGIDIDKPNQPYAVMAVTKDSELTEEPVKFIDYGSNQ